PSWRFLTRAHARAEESRSDADSPPKMSRQLTLVVKPDAHRHLAGVHAFEQEGRRGSNAPLHQIRVWRKAGRLAERANEIVGRESDELRERMKPNRLRIVRVDIVAHRQARTRLARPFTSRGAANATFGQALDQRSDERIHGQRIFGMNRRLAQPTNHAARGGVVDRESRAG